MIKTIPMLLIAACLFACSKENNNSVVPDPVVEGIAYDSLKMLVKEGSVLKYERIDSLVFQGDLVNRSTEILASLHWDKKNHEPDPYWNFIYKDTSLETVTISGSTRLKDLPTKYSSSFLQSLDATLTDTARVTVWYIRNQTWNRTDTAYVYLNPRILWMFTQTLYIPQRPVMQPLNVFVRLPLKKSGWNTGADSAHQVYSKTDTTLTINSSVYSPAIYLYTDSVTTPFSSGQVHNHDANTVFLSSSLGMIHHKNNVSYSGSYYERIFIMVRRRLLP